MFLTAQKHVGHDYQVKGDFASVIAVFTLDFVGCQALISSFGDGVFLVYLMTLLIV